MARLLVLGGTAEAARLADILMRDLRHDVVLSLAGRTETPASSPAQLRIGGFGGATGLATYLRAHEIDAVIDATHPFATQISANAASACETAHIPRMALVRPPWRKQGRDNWIPVGNEADAASVLPASARAFLALGSQHIAPFSSRKDVWFLLRVADQPNTPPLAAPHLIIVQRGPFALEDERALLETHAITHVVARNSGGDGARAKIDAAREMGLPVIMIERPAAPPDPALPDIDGLLAWLTSRLR